MLQQCWKGVKRQSFKKSSAALTSSLLFNESIIHKANPNRKKNTACHFEDSSSALQTSLLSTRNIKHFIQNRQYSSKKFTISNERDKVFESPNFSDVERPSTPTDTPHKAFSYFMVGATGVLGAIGAKSSVMNLLSTWGASGEALAMAQVEVDLSAIPEGKSIVIKWRGKPIFIRHRTGDEIQEAEGTPIGDLRDPQPDSDRVQKPEWIVMIGICTHLGCVPLSDSGDYNGWYCPCHGSHYDISGRIRKGPAPLNLEIPEYKFLDDDHIVIG